MKADKSQMFAVPLGSLKAEDGAPFPLFLFLKLNDRFVPIRLEGDPLGEEKLQKFLAKQHAELWVPNNFREAYNSYSKFAEQTGHPLPTAAEAIQQLEAAPEAKSEEAELVRDVLEDEELTTEEKAQVLSAVSQDLLRALNQITTRGEDSRAEGLKRCKEVADEILALRKSQEDIEHSVIVGTVAVMFGLSLGFTDDQMLADLTIAAIFHDIGLVRVKPEVVAKTEGTWSVPERQEYEKHVLNSVEILRESGTEFHPRVFRMVEEHHENYDGSGFPKGLRGAQIDETSQVLHMANLFDRLCVGKQTGEELSPAAAFDYIYGLAQDPGAVQEVQPELVERVFQFMRNEKDAADAMQKKAEARVESAMKKI